jgi:hypothetical protein
MDRVFVRFRALSHIQLSQNGIAHITDRYFLYGQTASRHGLAFSP